MQAPALHDDLISCRPVSGVDVHVQACMQVLLDVLGEEPVPAGLAPGVTLAPALPDREVVAMAVCAVACELAAGVQVALRPRVEACGRDVDLAPLGCGRLLELDGFAQPVAPAAIPLLAAGEFDLHEEVPDLLRAPADLEDEPRGRLARGLHGLAGSSCQRRQHGRLLGPLQRDVVAEELGVDDAGAVDSVGVRLAERQVAGQVRARRLMGAGALHSHVGRGPTRARRLQVHANSSKLELLTTAQ